MDTILGIRRRKKGAHSSPGRLQAEPFGGSACSGSSGHFSSCRNPFGLSELVSLLAGRPGGTDDASEALKLWRNSDASPATHRYPRSGLKRSTDEAFGTDPDNPKQDFKRTRIDGREHPSGFPTLASYHLSGFKPRPESHLNLGYLQLGVPNPQAGQYAVLPSSQFLASVENPGTRTDDTQSIQPGGQKCLGSIIEQEAEAIVPSKGIPPTPR
ncbi:hypothetical protein FRC04_010566 [Tulasnella sp. 424]|nr:hypothetical protein FRC04_010566 [Tulasnella sp. 424]